MKELEEAYAVYEGKLRTFAQARALMKNKAVGRGFFPTAKGTYGKSKDKKGKGYGSAPVLAASSPTRKGPGKVGSPDYSGCFICGAKDHSFQNCPKRGRKGTGPGKGSSPSYGIFMVTPWDLDVNEDTIGEDGIMLATEETHGWRTHGVIDCGATETVASLQAIEELMARRRELRDGQEEAIRVFSDVRKQFRFGNGQELQASSYIEIPQQINGCTFYLGIFTLDTEGYVPVLLGIKTLHRLGTVVDFANHRAAFTRVCQDWLPLVNCERTGHLLVDMSLDWMTPQFTTVYMAREGWLDLGTEVVEVPFEGHALVEDEQCADVRFESDDQQPMIAQASGSAGGAPPVELDSHGHDPHGEGDRSAGDVRCRQAEVQGEGQVQGVSEGQDSGLGQVRLQPGGEDGSAGPKGSGSPMQWDSRADADGPWLSLRQERARDVADVPEVSHTAVLCAGDWRSCPFPTITSPGQGRGGHPQGEDQRGGEPSGDPEHRQRGAGWCGTQSDEEAGRRESAEGDGLPAVQDEPVQEDGQEGRGGDRRGGRDYFATQLDSAGWRRGEVKWLNESQKAALFNEAANTVEMVEEAMADVESMCMMNSKAPVDLVEMCCPPDSSLAQMVLDLGGTAVRISEHNMNLSTRAGLEQALGFVRKEKPRWLWASFPCGPTSQVQSLNELTPEAKEKSLMRKKKSRRLVRRGLQVLRVHVFENGGQFAWEWPQSNQGWWFPEVQHFLKDVYQKTELYKTILHGCQVGVRADDGGFMKKPWKIYTTDRVWQRL